MKFRQREPDNPDINVTPLIDIVFLLLIFFMVSTTFKQEFEVGIDLPQASSQQRLEQKNLEITIDAQGRMAVNQEMLANNRLDTLKQALREIAGEQRRQHVVISADAKAPYQFVIRAMDAARQLGFSRLSFATRALEQ